MKYLWDAFKTRVKIIESVEQYCVWVVSDVLPRFEVCLRDLAHLAVAAMNSSREILPS